MGKKVEVLKGKHDESRGFMCPGCGERHTIRVKGNKGLLWGYNWNDKKPTFTPSLLVRSGHHAPGHRGPDCWCTYNEKHKDDPAPFTCGICHSFIREGKIQFLTDCTHKLAGKTVELPDIEPNS